MTDALDLPEGVYAIPDPHNPDTITYWRRQNAKTRRGTVPKFHAWPPKARNGPILYKQNVPAGLHGTRRMAVRPATDEPRPPTTRPSSTPSPPTRSPSAAASPNRPSAAASAPAP
ncbi:hypothetical protein AB0F17_34960 [Nonomuraea sp. NPDC026600]|uniref:hypothetical protein n=1 Tax=Nonomuraea sp. NPDC026600 TaxID=3155363 RepID=UPI0033F0D275